MSVVLILHTIVIIAALSGFLVAYRIRLKKRVGRPFVCPLNFDCHAVVNSDYSKFFGIPLEVLGMFYYAIIAVSYVLFVFFPQLEHALFAQTVLAISVIAFLFSLYLTYVQAKKLREWCTYCLVSAAMCTIIFCAVLGIKFLL